METELKTLFYFEVKIKHAGVTEDISIGFDSLSDSKGLWVKYKGNTGEILKHRKLVTYGPRFGAKDTIGVGITSEFYVYFTYNGFNLHIYVENEPISQFFPVIKLQGKNIHVKPKFSSFKSDLGFYPKIND